MYVIIDETMKDKKYLLAVNPDENHAINVIYASYTNPILIVPSVRLICLYNVSYQSVYKVFLCEPNMYV